MKLVKEQILLEEQLNTRDSHCNLETLLKHDTIKLPINQIQPCGKNFEKDWEIIANKQKDRKSRSRAFYEKGEARRVRCYSKIDENLRSIFKKELVRNNSQRRIGLCIDKPNLLWMRFNISKGPLNYLIVDYETDEKVKHDKKQIYHKYRKPTAKVCSEISTSNDSSSKE